MAKQVRLGIVGLGAQGSTYAQLITGGMVPNMEIGAICEANPVMAEVIRSKRVVALVEHHGERQLRLASGLIVELTHLFGVNASSTRAPSSRRK
jgi:hypothetical protein